MPALAQPGDAPAGDLRVGVVDADDDPGDAGVDEGVGARRRCGRGGEHGSRVTYTVAPAASAPAAAAPGDASAWRPPGGSVAPSKRRAVGRDEHRTDPRVRRRRWPRTPRRPARRPGAMCVLVGALLAIASAYVEPIVSWSALQLRGSVRAAAGQELEGVGHDVEHGLEALDRPVRRARGVEHERLAHACRPPPATGGRAG